MVRKSSPVVAHLRWRGGEGRMERGRGREGGRERGRGRKGGMERRRGKEGGSKGGGRKRARGEGGREQGGREGVLVLSTLTCRLDMHDGIIAAFLGSSTKTI